MNLNQDANIVNLRSNSKGALDIALNATPSKWTGTSFYKSHTYCQDDTKSNTNARKFSSNVEWSNCTATAEQDKMIASKGFQWNLLKNVQHNILYEVLNPHLLLNCLDVEPVINATLINAAKDPHDSLIGIQTFI